MKELILFILCFLFVLFIYEIFIVSRAKKRKGEKYPMEVTYLISRYKLNMKKVNYNQLLQIIALVSSLDISIVVTLTSFFDNFVLELLVAFITIVITILVSYHLVGNFYKKKGKIKDE